MIESLLISTTVTSADILRAAEDVCLLAAQDHPSLIRLAAEFGAMAESVHVPIGPLATPLGPLGPILPAANPDDVPGYRPWPVRRRGGVGVLIGPYAPLGLEPFDRDREPDR